MSIFKRMSLKEKMFFARNMAIMSRSGMQTLDTLKALRKQSRVKSYRKMMDRIIKDIRNGQMLHESLEKQEVFGSFFINVVKIGEMSGGLSDNLDYLADTLEKQREIKSKAVGAVVYPIVILVATLGIMGIITFFVFPKILPVFEGLNVELPITTKIFIVFATFATEYTGLMFIILGALVVAVFLLLRLKKVRYAWHWFLLRIPFVGSMVRNYNMVNFMRTLSMLLKSNTKIVQALSITADTTNNLVYKRTLKAVSQKVKQGENMSDSLEKEPKLFSPILVQMIAVGEKTGTLDESGLFLSDFYEKELDASTKAVTNVIEPLLLLIMGAGITFIALAIIQPIYGITSAFNR